MSLLEEWVSKAEADYDTAAYVSLRTDKPLPDIVCFHSHQCAEKYLEAVLVSHGEAVPRVHDINGLLARCTVLDETWRALESDVTDLSAFGPALRYPGMSASADDAAEALRLAGSIRAAIRAELGL